MTSDPGSPSRWAQRLGYGGLLPFMALAAALWVVGPAHQTQVGLALLGYGATIASFLGAIHWGLVMRSPPADPPAPWLLWGVVPSLLGWGALLLGPVLGLWLLAALLWACFAVDRVVYPRFQLQGWLPLRWRLTLVASVACAAGAVALRS